MKRFINSMIIPGACIGLAALLIACMPDPKHEFDSPRESVALEVKVFKNELELNRYLKENFKTEATRAGFSRWYVNDPNNECTIFVVDPRETRSLVHTEKTWGHELLHCVYGSFHKESIK